MHPVGIAFYFTLPGFDLMKTLHSSKVHQNSLEAD